MDIRWYGQSAFLLTGEKSVFVDPFGDPATMAGRGIEFRYPPIEGVTVGLVLVTHEHFDHNAVDAIGGETRSRARSAGRTRSFALPSTA